MIHVNKVQIINMAMITYLLYYTKPKEANYKIFHLIIPIV